MVIIIIAPHKVHWTNDAYTAFLSVLAAFRIALFVKLRVCGASAVLPAQGCRVVIQPYRPVLTTPGWGFPLKIWGLIGDCYVHGHGPDDVSKDCSLKLK